MSEKTHDLHGLSDERLKALYHGARLNNYQPFIKSCEAEIQRRATQAGHREHHDP